VATPSLAARRGARSMLAMVADIRVIPNGVDTSVFILAIGGRASAARSAGWTSSSCC
jgi:hypothetical protein